MARFMIKASEFKNVCKAVNDRKLADLKKEIIEILKKQDEKEVKKAIDYFNSQELHYTHLEKSFTGKWIEKAGYGIGTVRIWKGKKYKKIAPGKWARVFEKEGRGTNIAIGKLIARVQKIDNVEDLMAFVMQNKQRFVDEQGFDLPVLDKLRAAVDARNGNVGSKEETTPMSADKVKEIHDKIEENRKKGKKVTPYEAQKQIDDEKLMDKVRKINEEAKKKAENQAETSKQTDYYKDISEVLTKDEKRRINEKVEEYSKENEWSIPAADMKKFVKDWQSALKETDKHAKAEKLYEIYSKLEDANWHDENKKLLAGNFEYFNDKYFKNMYGEEPEEKPAEKKTDSKEDLNAALKEVEDAIDNAGDYDDIEELEKERKEILKKMGKKPAEKPTKKTFKQEMNELYDAQDKAWEGFESGSEIKSSPENSKKFYDRVKKYVDDNNIKLSQKHYDEIEEMNGHSFNEALELAGAYGAEKREKAIAKNKEINKKYKGALLDLSMIDEFKESEAEKHQNRSDAMKGKKEIIFNNHVIEIEPSNVDSDKLLITIDGKTVHSSMLKNRQFDNDKDVLNYLKTKWSDEFSNYFKDFSSLSDAMKGNKNAYKGGHDDEPVHNKVSKNGVYYTFDGFSGGLNRSFRQAKDLPQNIKDNINNSVKRYLDYVDNYTNEGYKKVADDMVKNPEKYQHMSMEEFTKETGYDKEDAREIINLKVSMEFADKLRNFNLDETMISKDAEQNFRNEIYPVSLKQNIQEGFLPNQIAEIESQKTEKAAKKENVVKKPSGKIATSNPDKLKPISTHEIVGEGKVKLPYSKEVSDEIKQLTNSVAEIKVSDTRNALMNKVYYDKGNLVATDGKCMKIIKVGELSGIDNGTYVDINNSKDGITITADKEFTKYHKFPQYERVLPRDNKEKIVLDNKALISKIKDLKKDGSISNKDSFVTFDIQGNDLMLDGVKVGDVSAAIFEGEDSNYFNIDSNLLTKYLSGDFSELMSSKDNSKAMYLGNDSAINIIMPQTKYEYNLDSSGNQKREIRRKDYESLREGKKLGDEAKANKKAAQKTENNKYVTDLIERIKKDVDKPDFGERMISKLKDWTTEQLQRLHKQANADIEHLMEVKDFNANSFMTYTDKNFGVMPRVLIQQNYAMKQHPEIVREVERLLEERGVKVEKSLFGDFITDMLVDEVIEDEEEVEENETEYNDYSAEQPELFNSTEFLVREALNRRYNCM